MEVAVTMPRVFYTSRYRFVLQGLLCGLVMTGIENPCGGAIMGKDYSYNPAMDPDFRYGLWCEKCHCATPPGIAEESQIIPAAITYFKATEPAEEISNHKSETPRPSAASAPLR